MAIAIGDKVRESPVGAGIVTGFTPRGYPKVKDIAVAWLVLESGVVYDPRGVYELHRIKRENECGTAQAP